MTVLTSESRPGVLIGLLGFGSALCLSAAFWFEHAEGLEPCPLCIDQRWAHGVSLGLAVIGAVAVPRRLAWVAMAVLAAAFAAGALLAAWHVMVEWRWVTTSACDAPPLSAATIDELEAALLQREVVRCDVVPWSLAGVSMAGWNAIVSFLLAGAAAAGSFVCRRSPA